MITTLPTSDMDVLILSKTSMNSGRCCVGGISLTDDRQVRLLATNGDNQPEDTKLHPGQVWDIEFAEREKIEPPHVEDVLVHSMKFKYALNGSITDFLSRHEITVWEGEPDELFNQKLKWTPNGSGYINHDDIPDCSVGFWVSDKDLTLSYYRGKSRYSCKTINDWRNITYVGFDEPIKIIPTGTLIRVSLARWWDTKGTTEPRCALQLSGWYDLQIS